jgi:superfamily II DNA or RNA helicase
VGDVALRFAAEVEGGVRAELWAGDELLTQDELSRSTDKREGFVASIAEGEGPTEPLTIRSFNIPRPLRPWVRAFVDGRPLNFPKEAVTEVLAQTGPLMLAGMAEFPRVALGAELRAEPAIGLRVEWRPDGSALVRAMFSAHPLAPLVSPGRGPNLFSFMEENGERAFVERDLHAEADIVLAARGMLPLAFDWHDNVASTQSIEDSLALAEFITQNQRAFEEAGTVTGNATPRYRVEVRAGRSPHAVPFDTAKSTFSVRRAGAYLFVSGEIELNGAKVTLGEVLEALRKAKRYVRAGEQGFLELTEEVRRKLLPLASVATPSGEEESSARVHQALAVVVAAAGETFADRKGVDVAELITRHKESAAKALDTATLEQGTLRRYQEEGVEFLLRLSAWASGGILADDMGLGKTVQTASVLRARHSLGPALVVAPASVVSNWERELARFVPSLRVRSMYEDPSADLTKDGAPADVLITSYGLLARRRKELEKMHFATLVLDEAHYVKNVSAARTAAVRALTRDFTIALTGTPLENHLGELYSLVDVTLPGVFGSEQLFRERFRRPIEVEGDKERLQALGRLLAPFLLRRTRASVLAELPPREEIVETLTFSDEESQRYRALREAAILSFGKRKKENREKPKDAELRIALFAALTRLRQLACDPRLVDGSYEGATTKVTRVVELVSQIADEGAHVLVYSQFAELVKLVAKGLKEAGIEPLVLTGETRPEARQKIVDTFQSGTHAALCASLMAGGVGLNLTRASHVIHVDPWWNPAAEEQATSRAHRMGQTEPVTVVRLITKGTIEEAVLKMHAEKRSLADAILSGKSAPVELTSEDLLKLLSFGHSGA